MSNAPSCHVIDDVFPAERKVYLSFSTHAVETVYWRRVDGRQQLNQPLACNDKTFVHHPSHCSFLVTHAAQSHSLVMALVYIVDSICWHEKNCVVAISKINCKILVKIKYRHSLCSVAYRSNIIISHLLR